MIAIEAVTTTGRHRGPLQSVGLAARIGVEARPVRAAPRAASSRALGPAEPGGTCCTRAVRGPAEVQACADVLCSTRTMYHSRSGSGAPNAIRRTRNRSSWRGPESDLAWDITKLRPLPVLLAVRISSVATSWAGWSPRTRPPGPAPDRGDVPQARPQNSRSTRPRRADAQQAPRFHGIEASHSPSNDNPCSEAQFRTVKYRPDFRTAVPRTRARDRPRSLRVVQRRASTVA